MFLFCGRGGTFCSLRFQGTPAGYQSSKIHRQNKNKSEKRTNTGSEITTTIRKYRVHIQKNTRGGSVLFFRRFGAHLFTCCALLSIFSSLRLQGTPTGLQSSKINRKATNTVGKQDKTGAEITNTIRKYRVKSKNKQHLRAPSCFSEGFGHTFDVRVPDPMIRYQSLCTFHPCYFPAGY
jgi:hypothetical protein